MIPRVLACLAVGGIALTPGACASDPSKGYAFSSTFDENVQSVAVPIFRNETTSRGLEVRLTEAVIKQIQRRTPWHIASTERADTSLVGTITGVDLAVLSDDPRTGLAQEQAVQITIRFQWRDNRSGDILVSRDKFTASSVFSPAREVGDRIELGQREAIEELANDVISQLRSSW